MKLLIFLILLLLVVLSIGLMQKKISLKEFLMVGKTVFFISSLNFFTLLIYHLFNAFNEINRLQFTDLKPELSRMVQGTTSIVLMGIFLYFILFGIWMSLQSLSEKKYNASSTWLNPLLAGAWFTLNTGFILLTLNVFSL